MAIIRKYISKGYSIIKPTSKDLFKRWLNGLQGVAHT
jgi:hypothetical protein